jgi:dihydrolipoamide dehydrogenase
MTHVLVLGGGPAGYVAALRAAQLGARVTLVEAREIGGTCLNRGCIPTKAMVAAAERLRLARSSATYGVLAAEPKLDYAAMATHRDASAVQLREGVEHLLKGRKVEVVEARGRLAGPRALELDDGRVLEGDAVILATGSEPAWLPVFPTDDPRVVSSDGILRLSAVPRRLVVVGGGVIGCEFAAIFAELGSQVTIVELLDQLLPGEDKRTGRALQQAFKKRGIEARLKVSAEGVVGTPDGVGLTLSSGDELQADVVLVSVGRRPVARDIGFEEAGVEVDRRGFIVADESLRTAVDGVFAAGDAAGPPLLAHWAYYQGALAAENAVTGSSLIVDRRVVPNCVFTHPEVASCGITEDKAAAEGIEVEIAHVRFNGNSKAVIEGEDDGFVRIVVEKVSGIVLGASLLGPKATELVHELALAAQNRLTLEAVWRTIHAHPTLSEAVGEAALSGAGRGMHSL